MRIRTCLMLSTHYYPVTQNSVTALTTRFVSPSCCERLATTGPFVVTVVLPFSRLSYSWKCDSLSKSTPLKYSTASRPVNQGQEVSSPKQRGPRPPMFQLSSLCSPRALGGDQPLALARMVPPSALSVLKVPGKSLIPNMVSRFTIIHVTPWLLPSPQVQVQTLARHSRTPEPWPLPLSSPPHSSHVKPLRFPRPQGQALSPSPSSSPSPSLERSSLPALLPLGPISQTLPGNSCSPCRFYLNYPFS